jgi:hypothetical protein
MLSTRSLPSAASAVMLPGCDTLLACSRRSCSLWQASRGCVSVMLLWEASSLVSAVSCCSPSSDVSAL